MTLPELSPNKLFAWIKRIQKDQDSLILEYQNRLLDYFSNRTLKTLQPIIDALILKIQTDPEITVVQLKKTAEYKQLIQSVQDELEEYASYASTQIALASNASIGNAVAASIALFGLIDIPDPTIVTPTAVEILTGYLDSGGELLGRIDLWSNFHTQKVVDSIIEGVSLGRNPVKIGRDISRAIGGSLTDSIRTTRTLQLWSYREATRANYIANPEITAWIWYAELDGKTCMSCINLHGRVFSLSEQLNDHHNGRCDMLPYPQGIAVLANEGVGSGQEWFESQSADIQKEMMGEEKYNAWINGEFEFEKLTQEYQDPVYGAMRNETSLKGIRNV